MVDGAPVSTASPLINCAGSHTTTTVRQPRSCGASFCIYRRRELRYTRTKETDDAKKSIYAVVRDGKNIGAKSLPPKGKTKTDGCKDGVRDAHVRRICIETEPEKAGYQA